MKSAAISHVQTHNSQADAAPTSLEAEQSLLGVLLYDQAAYDAVRDTTRPEHFSEPVHGRLYAAMAKLLVAGRPALPELIAPQFAADPAFHDLGGFAYLGHLLDKAPHVDFAAELALELASAHTRRSIILLGKDAITAARMPSMSVEEILGEIERGAAELGRSTFTRDHWLSGGDVVTQALESAAARDGRIEFSLGVDELDEMTGGAHAGELTLLAGRPGMAKTTVVGRMALENAKKGLGTLVFSLEMGIEPMGLRMACDVAYRRDAVVYSLAPEASNPTVKAAMGNRLSPDQRRRMYEAQRLIADLSLKLDVRSGLSMAQIEAAARRAHRQWERLGITPGPVFIDHIGKVRPDKDRAGSKHAEMADISGAAAELAKRLGVPLIACAQLNRGVESRGEDKRPVLSDLRQAGELEEDARQVVFLYRPEYYYRPPENPSAETPERRFEREKKLDLVRNKLFFLVEKNSHGPTGQVEAFCDVSASVVRDQRR